MNPQNLIVKHGGTMNEDLIDFSISVNPYKPRWIRDIFKRAEELVERYIYWYDLELELGNMIGEKVTVVAGTTESLYLVGMYTKGRRYIIPTHTYGEYERIGKIFGSQILKLPISKMYECVKKNDVIFLCNPNNPTGKYYKKWELKPIIDVAEDTNSLVVLDEAFIDFVREKDEIRGENIINLRTFTKSYGVPGIRVGYIIGHDKIFRNIRMPWSIGSLGYAFLEFLIEDRFKFLDESLPKIWRGKEFIEKELDVKSDVNFFIKKVGNVRSVVNRLVKKGIFVRDCSSFGLPEYIRFSVRSHKENIKLVESLREVLD